MEGNECYKFATIRKYIDLTDADPVRVMIEIGANVGTITRMMKAYFPDASVGAYEAVAEYAGLAAANTRHLPGVTILRRAVTGTHLYHDDLGASPRRSAVGLRVLKGLPEAGPGWGGGSIVVAADSPVLANGGPRGYQLLDDDIAPVSLDEVVADALAREGADRVDILKLDCEGCEHSSLGAAAAATLERIRFIVGEYHGIERFYRVMRNKLYRTHKVNLIGQRDLGAFFAERLDGDRDGILHFDKTGMLVPRPWLAASDIDWHLFNARFVPPGEQRSHALA